MKKLSFFNPLYEDEYGETLAAAADATLRLRLYLEQNSSLYISKREGQLLDEESDALSRLRKARKNYFAIN